jgi:hypothetical protein
MRNLVVVGLLLALVMPNLALGQTDFDGTWKIDLNKSQLPTTTQVFLLQNGTYQCKSCVPMIKVKADATDQTVSGSPYFDTIGIRVVDERSIEETRKKNGKVVAVSKMTVSPDGNTAAWEYTDDNYTTAAAVVGRNSMVRIGKSKRSTGPHAISGSWRFSKMETLSDNALTFTLRVEGGMLSMTSLIGESYSAKLDGTEAPYKGDPRISSVSVRKLSKGTFEETDLHDGKAIRVKRMMIDPADLKTVNTIVTDNLTGASTLLVATKQ